MPQLELGALTKHILALEKLRNRRVLVLAASHVEMAMLPALYELCQEIDPTSHLDVVLHGRGGIVNAARRIALLLRRHCKSLSFIVPFHCESAATLLTLCADEIIAGELALFSPIDPQLNGADGSAFSALDIQRFGDMAQAWFGLDADEARQQSLALLCNSVFPPSLTAFHRTSQELAQIGVELLSYQLPNATPLQRQQVIEQLMAGYHSHNYAITGEELAELGLNVQRDASAEAIAWEISKIIQATVGAGMRESEEAPWIDALFANRSNVQLRQQQANGMQPQWISERLST